MLWLAFDPSMVLIQRLTKTLIVQTLPRHKMHGLAPSGEEGKLKHHNSPSGRIDGSRFILDRSANRTADNVATLQKVHDMRTQAMQGCKDMLFLYNREDR